MTYADKYDARRYSTYRLYRNIRSKVPVNAQICRFYPNVLDHVVLDDGDNDTALIEQVAQSPFVDDAAASIQRFASRCWAADKSEMMVVKRMSRVLAASMPFSKPIIDVLLLYGAKLDPNTRNYFNRACLRGMNEFFKQAIENGHVVVEHDINAAIASGNCETIKLVYGAYRGRNTVFYPIDLINATVQSMEFCLSLNIIQRGTHYEFSNIPSFSVLQWILDHDVMEHDEILIDIAFSASRYSGHYFDMLRYLIEQRNFTVPRDILIKMYLSQATDLGVFDLLLRHGADVNAVNRDGQNVLEDSPMLIRYWIDNGLVVQSNDANSLIDCMHHGMTAPVLEMMIDKYELNVNAIDEYCWTALHEACQCERFELVKMLLSRGADVNRRDVLEQTPYRSTHDDRIKQLLIQYGYKHNN